MAFALHRPFALITAVKQLPKSTSVSISLPTRAFHSSPIKHSSFSKPTSPFTTITKNRHAFQSSFRRTYIPQTPTVNSNSATLTQRLLYGAGVVGATLIATNLLFNRETREDGGMPPFERQYLNETFLHTGLGVGMIGVAAQALHKSGWSYRLMATNPWVVIGVSLAASVGTMYGCFATHPDK